MSVTPETEFILGARDPEMDFIERVLRKKGLKVTYARQSDGERVHYGSAYPSRVGTGPINQPYPGQVWVECAPAEGGKDTLKKLGIPFIDHHYPGDPGYDCQPSEYWEGSSVGQLHMMLEMAGSREAHVVAAIDHCINAAYRGECVLNGDPKDRITPEEILRTQIEGMCRHTSRPKEQIAESIQEWRERLRAHMPTQHRTRGGMQVVHEFLRTTITQFWDYLCVREAALVERVCVAVVTKFDEPECDPKLKLNIVGHPSADFIEKFLGGADIYPGVTNRYGSPTRGYGGGYIAPVKREGRLHIKNGLMCRVIVEHVFGEEYAQIEMKETGVVIRLPLNRLNASQDDWTCELA